jgi:YidC/Oxa1 family membrane protein insertase
VLADLSLDPLYRVVGWLLAFFYSVPPHSLGIAIILLTIAVMLVQFPLIAKQTRSMIQMQRVQPEIKKIQQQYKDDRQKQNEELLKFYQENKINPIAGCLPILVTLPIGIAVFRTFAHGVQKHIPTTGPFKGLYDDLCTFQGKTVSVSQCTKALDNYPKGQTPPTFKFLGMNLDWSAREVQTQLSGQYLHWVPYFLLIALVVLTGWYQVKQTQARQTRQGGAAPNTQMQMVTRIMPVLFGLITYGLNAATTLYFLVSNCWRIGQQHFVLNKMYEESAAGKTSAGDTKAAAKGDAPPPPDDGNGNTKPAPNRPSPNARRNKKKRKR